MVTNERDGREAGTVSDRLAQILEQVTENGRVEVTKLAEQFGVSQVTVRKDLDALEQKGLVRREHGFAVTSLGDDVAGRLAYHYDRKRRLAAMAAELVSDGETVMIESGSCCALLAEELARTRSGLTVVTNSAFIADYLRRWPQAKVVLLGGDFQPESQVMVGPLVRTCAERFFVDKLFIGTDGFAPGYGFTGKDHMRAEAVWDMARQARRVIVLTESEKFSRQGAAALLPADRVAGVVTDDRLPEEIEWFLTEHGAEVRKAPTD